ncbi:MAG: hypothetical protein U0531_01445 [Dehalococcoidia bacterium]
MARLTFVLAAVAAVVVVCLRLITVARYRGAITTVARPATPTAIVFGAGLTPSRAPSPGALRSSRHGGRPVPRRQGGAVAAQRRPSRLELQRAGRHAPRRAGPGGAGSGVGAR